MRNFDELMCEILEVDNLEEDKKLCDFDEWSSLVQLSILASVEQEYKKRLTYEIILNSTIGELRNLVK
jgi:hypothetical protein